MLIEVFSAFLASLGFGILFNIKGEKLIMAAFTGSLGWFAYKMALWIDFSEVEALFLAAVVFSIFSEVFARVFKTPVTTFIICALIPLVPGGGMYYTMVEAISGNALKALDTALDTLASAGALALGVVFISTSTKVLMAYRIERKVTKGNEKNNIGF